MAALPERAARDLTIRHLYQFLLSTAHLETRIVNRAAELIANDRSGVDLPAARRLDAFKVYCDEGYHSLYSLDLADQIATETGVPVPDWDYGGFVDALEAAGARLLPHAPASCRCSRSWCSRRWSPRCSTRSQRPDVLTVVRDLTRDHAKDEGHHHRFFADFFHRLWTQLDPGCAARWPAPARAGPRLPELGREPVVGSLRAGRD